VGGGGGSTWLKASVIRESGYSGKYLVDIAYVNMDIVYLRALLNTVINLRVFKRAAIS